MDLDVQLDFSDTWILGIFHIQKDQFPLGKRNWVWNS